MRLKNASLKPAALLITAVMLLFLCACGNDNDEAEKDLPQEPPAPAAAQTANHTRPIGDDADGPLTNYNNLPLLTQADVENYIAVMGEIIASKGEENRIAAAYKKAGWNQRTAQYVTSKVEAIYAMLAAPTKTKSILAQYPGMRIYRTEVDLVQSNHPKLMHVFMQTPE